MATKLFCDVCGREIDCKDIMDLRLYDASGPRQHLLNSMDICADCIKEFVFFVKWMRGSNEGTGD